MATLSKQPIEGREYVFFFFLFFSFFFFLSMSGTFTNEPWIRGIWLLTSGNGSGLSGKTRIDKWGKYLDRILLDSKSVRGLDEKEKYPHLLLSFSLSHSLSFYPPHPKYVHVKERLFITLRLTALQKTNHKKRKVWLWNDRNFWLTLISSTWKEFKQNSNYFYLKSTENVWCKQTGKKEQGKGRST